MANPKDHASRPPTLTQKQKLYALYFVASAPRFNKTDAARKAGYKGSDETLRAIGYENFTKPHIKAEIDRLMQAEVMDAQEVMWRFSDLVRGSLEDFIDVAPRVAEGRDGKEFKVYDIGRINLKKAADAGKLHLLKRYRVTKQGINIELHDPQTALLNLAKHYGLLKDETTINVNIDITLINQVVEGLKATGVDPNEFFKKVYEKLGVDVGAGAE